MKISMRGILPALVLGAVTVTTSFATTINLQIAGDAEVTSTSTSASISFGQYPVGAPYTPAPGTGTFQVSNTPGLPFSAAGVVAGESGTIQSLSSTLEPAGVTLTPAVNFINFIGGGSNLELFLTELLPEGGPGDPFLLTDTTNGATASFSVDGYIWNTTTGTSTPYTGLFSATFDGVSVAQLLAQQTTDTSFSATFQVNTTPEPASLLLMGVGLLGAGVVARKRFSR